MISYAMVFNFIASELGYNNFAPGDFKCKFGTIWGFCDNRYVRPNIMRTTCMTLIVVVQSRHIEIHSDVANI